MVGPYTAWVAGEAVQQRKLPSGLSIGLFLRCQRGLGWQEYRRSVCQQLGCGVPWHFLVQHWWLWRSCLGQVSEVQLLLSQQAMALFAIHPECV